MSPDIINMLLGNSKDDRADCGNINDDNKSASASGLTPQKLLVIAALLADVLVVDSVLVDAKQRIEILLAGSLRKGKSTDNVMEQLGKMPLEQVIKTLVEKMM